jgi:hypothetical protein
MIISSRKRKSLKLFKHVVSLLKGINYESVNVCFNLDSFFSCHVMSRTCFGSTYTKIGMIQRRLAWPLRKDDTQNREAFHIFLSVNLAFEGGTREK